LYPRIILILLPHSSPPLGEVHYPQWGLKDKSTMARGLLSPPLPPPPLQRRSLFLIAFTTQGLPQHTLVFFKVEKSFTLAAMARAFLVNLPTQLPPRLAPLFPTEKIRFSTFSNMRLTVPHPRTRSFFSFSVRHTELGLAVLTSFVLTP